MVHAHTHTHTQEPLLVIHHFEGYQALSYIMSWPFCQQCGTILDPPINDFVKCSFCPFKCRFEDLDIPEVVTKSNPTHPPAWIEPEAKTQEAKDKHATIAEPCPKCGNPEQYFYTMQLRSVDEGSTVFYECPKCSYKYSVNN
jgi:DNA-directed RNA polymerase I subunit RPA12